MTNTPNKDKHDADRWEAFLDTVFARSKKIKEVRISIVVAQQLKVYMHGAGYDGLCMGLAEDPPHLWDVPVVIDDTLTSPKIVYLDGVPDPTYKMADLLDKSGKLPKIKPLKEKPVDTWLDDEV